MKKLILILISSSIYSQVSISVDNKINIHSKASLIIKAPENKAMGVYPTSVSKMEYLPLYNNLNTNYFDKDETMKGMLMYENKHATFYTYDGEKWINEKSKENFKLNKSRFLSNKDDQQSVVCALLVACGHHEALKFNAPIDGEKSYNNLNIKTETASIKYGLITYNFSNAKFIIEEPGVYEISISIPSKTGGAVSLTSGPRYQLRGYLQDENGTFQESKLTDFAPDYYGILGIGGDTNTGAYSSTQIRLKKGDYIIPRIDSPGATVSVAVTMTAASNELIAENYPREIIFTKISD